jgi:hypothetical protein
MESHASHMTVAPEAKVQLNLQNNIFYILTIYRSPSGNFTNFVNYLEHILQLLYKPKIDLIICGDIKINYLEESNRVKQLIALI